MAIDAQPSQPLRAAEELLDRDDEVELLAGVVRDAIGGRGTVVFVEGPPGIGKSALLAAAAGIARRLEFVVLAARAHELEQMWAWGVGRSLLEPALATLSGADREELLESAGAAATLFLPGAPADGLDEPRDGYGVVHGFYRMVTRLAEHRPLLLSIDDAQWADSPSLRFILHLLGRISATRIAVLVGARRGEQGHELLERLATDQVTVTLQVTPLREEAVAALVRRSVPAAAAGRLIFPVFWHLTTRVVNFGTPIGRRVLPKIKAGKHPLVRVKRKHLEATGVEIVPRTVGTRQGLPLLRDDRAIDVCAVVWCTGYEHEHDWIDVPILDESGDLACDHRGVVAQEPGLYRIGREFLYAASSHTIGGVYRDAERVVKLIASAGR